jgi:YVTN family beta-propeller protein
VTETASYPQWVAISPDGSRAYVTDASTSVWVVDTSHNSVAGKIEFGMDPEAIVMSPDGKSIYVTAVTCGDLLCSGPSKPAQMASVEVIDTATASLKAIITFGFPLSGIAISPDGSRGYVAQANGGHIWTIDTATNTFSATIALTSSSLGDVSLSPDGKILYVVGETNGRNSNSDYVEVIDTQTNTATTSISLAARSLGAIGRLALTPDGSCAYVAGDSGTLSVIDTTKNAVATSMMLANANLFGVAITPDGTRAYVAADNNKIYVLDTATNRVLDTVRSDEPGGLAIRRAM